MVSHWTWSLLFQLHQLASKSQDPCFPSSSAGVSDTCDHAQSFLWVLTILLQILRLAEHMLATEPAHQLLSSFLSPNCSMFALIWFGFLAKALEQIMSNCWRIYFKVLGQNHPIHKRDHPGDTDLTRDLRCGHVSRFFQKVKQIEKKGG